MEILEDALSEESVCRHDVWFVLCCCVVDAAFRVVPLVAEVDVLCRKFDGRHVKFARKRGVVCCKMMSILIICASKACICFKPVCIGMISIAYRLAIYEDKKNYCFVKIA